MNDKVSILIVDDRPEKVLALEAVLEDLDQEIVRAYSGREALRHVLNQEFAVILLDVNMPGMDGFETASLIRQRRSSEHTPIIFITSFGDEMHASQGYSLGAVDYILAPVMPDVLRTKVSVFVDLFRKSQQLQRQAEWLRQRASQMQKLAAASVAINSALSMERMLQTITDAARDVIGAHQAITLFIPPSSVGLSTGRSLAVGSFSERYSAWIDRPLRLDELVNTVVASSRSATRLSEAELYEHADWEIVSKLDIPPIRGGMLAVPLVGRDGGSFGVIYLTDRDAAPFTTDDEAILVQLAQMASIAIENTLFSQEREANRAKDEFLATLSHELRTPLNAMLGWTQLLRSEDELDNEMSHGLEVIERNVRAQAKLVEDLLDVSRITSGKLSMTARLVSPGSVVETAVDTVRPAAEAKGILVHVSLHPTPMVMADPDRLQQVVCNILTNAVKFTDPGGQVQLTLDADGGAVKPQVRIRINDNGRGIPPRFLPHVFDRFRQADSSSTRSHGGLGIGLTIVRHIVEALGGTVDAQSDGEGHGSTFTVLLPAQGPPEEVKDRAASHNGHAGAAPLRPSAVRPEERSDPILKGLRVLLVEDDTDTRDLLYKALHRAGADVVAVASVRTAMESISARMPDIIISDIAMPEEDGYDLIRQVRSLTPEAGSLLPAVALTAYARSEDRIRALAAGFQEHLSKPVNPDQLVAVVAGLCREPVQAARSS